MSGRPPRRAVALAPGEFGVAFQLAIDAGEGRAGTDPESATTSPYERAALALRGHFPEDDEKYESAFMRFQALMHLYTRNALGVWVRDAGRGAGGTDIHPAVLDVASTMRLARNGRYPMRKFLEEVARIARERYAELAEWPIAAE